MYRKISHILLFALLLAATTGLAVAKHFCNESLISYSLYTEADSCCDDDCCRDSLEFVQLAEKFQLSESSAIPVITELGLLFTGPEYFDFMSGNEFVHILKTGNEPPPPGLTTRLSLRQTYLL